MFSLMILLALPLLALAAPATRRAELPTDFYLVATSAKNATANSTGINLADPYYDPQYFLRVLEDASRSLDDIGAVRGSSCVGLAGDGHDVLQESDVGGILGLFLPLMLSDTPLEHVEAFEIRGHGSFS